MGLWRMVFLGWWLGGDGSLEDGFFRVVVRGGWVFGGWFFRVVVGGGGGMEGGHKI